MYGLSASEKEVTLPPACGAQAEAPKQSLPSWSWSKAQRDKEKKVFISNKHSQDLLGKDSPGFEYTPKRLKHAPGYGFGTAPARPALAKPKYPESMNDLVGTIPDNQKYKFKSRSVSVGTCSRWASANSPDYEGFPLGAVSPGPQRYTPSRAPPAHRFAHAPKVDQVQPSYTMRPKTKVLEADSQTPARVGPGSYLISEACGDQVNSSKPTKAKWSVNKTDRFPQKVQIGDSGRLWDGTGDRKVQFNRTFSSPPSYSFGTSERHHKKKVQPVYTDQDKGPAATMPTLRRSHPTLPSRGETMKFSYVQAA